MGGALQNSISRFDFKESFGVLIINDRGGDKKFYYRRCDGSWSPWEHIKLDIQDIPVVWKGEHGSRLLLFWLTILKQAQTDPSLSSSSGVQGPGKPKSLAECTVSEIKDSSKAECQP